MYRFDNMDNCDYENPALAPEYWRRYKGMDGSYRHHGLIPDADKELKCSECNNVLLQVKDSMTILVNSSHGINSPKPGDGWISCPKCGNDQQYKRSDYE